jgi:NADPH:quinone reductase-like Zn-dependent oxidoreductase
MKRIELRAFGKPTMAPELVETESPEPGLGQVVVALEAAPINPSDLLLITGHYGYRPSLPAALGAEGVGRIVAVGHGVDPVRIGERVLIVPTMQDGTWQDQTVIDETGVVPVDSEADALQLAMVGINPLTADLLLRRCADVPPGAWVAQTGANSAVGRYVIALARQAGVRTLNVVRRPEVAEELLEIGADAVVVSGPDLEEQVEKVLGDERIALLLDPIGGDAVDWLTAWLAFGATVVSYGAMSRAPLVLSVPSLIFGDVRVRGFWLNHWLEISSTDEIGAAYTRLAALVADGTLHAPVAATYPLHQYRDALAHAAESGRDGKVLFRW